MQYRVYHIEKEITFITKKNLDGEYVIVENDLYKKVQDNPSAYFVENNKVLEKNKQSNKGKRLRFVKQFPGYVVEKDNISMPISYHEQQPEWYVPEDYSIVNYD